MSLKAFWAFARCTSFCTSSRSSSALLLGEGGGGGGYFGSSFRVLLRQARKSTYLEKHKPYIALHVHTEGWRSGGFESVAGWRLEAGAVQKRSRAHAPPNITCSVLDYIYYDYILCITVYLYIYTYMCIYTFIILYVYQTSKIGKPRCPSGRNDSASAPWCNAHSTRLRARPVEQEFLGKMLLLFTASGKVLIPNSFRFLLPPNQLQRSEAAPSSPVFRGKKMHEGIGVEATRSSSNC